MGGVSTRDTRAYIHIDLLRRQMGALFAVFWFMRRKIGGAESCGAKGFQGISRPLSHLNRWL